MQTLICIKTYINLFKNHSSFVRIIQDDILKWFLFHFIWLMLMQIVSIPDVGFDCNHFISISHHLVNNMIKYAKFYS